MKITKPKFPARIHVLLARDKKFGVVIRRGPTGSTCVLGWNRAKNKFIVGQWLRGKIYERRSDLSPDGFHMIYFAMNGRWRSEAKGAWTAISRAPWLKAVTLLAKGDCWHGGGLFLSNNTYWLNDGYGHQIINDSGEVKRDFSYAPKTSYGGEDLNVYYNRLQRDGWVLKTREKAGKSAVTTFEKNLIKDWVLKKIAHEQTGPPRGKGCYWDEHELSNREGAIMKQPDWEWAEWVDGRLVWAEKGRLYKATIKSAGKIGKSVLLHDFNGYLFEKIAAPYDI